MVFISLQSLVLCIWLSHNIKNVDADAVWTRFITGPSYHESKMLVGPNAIYFPPVYITKGNSYTSSAMNCVQLCTRNSSCQATNFYEKNDSYVCDLVGDNYCNNQSTKALIAFKGGIVWNKVGTNTPSFCFGVLQVLNSTLCSAIRPGCMGTWPDCYNCTKTCIDWNQRGTCGGTSVCTLWPDGDAPDSVPIFGYCFNNQTFLVRRKIDHIMNIFTSDYIMSLPDMHRLYRLGVYETLRFVFKHSNGSESYSDYANSYIDANGTLSNMTYVGSMTRLSNIAPPGDIFRTNNLPLEPKPFVTVTDDIYGCGSFWLLDPNNATYCPGGEIKILGNGIPVGGTVNLSTIIRYPGAPSSEAFTVASIILVNP